MFFTPLLYSTTFRTVRQPDGGGSLRVDDRIKALHAILEGDASAENFTCLNDDWDVEERCLSALASWNLEHLQLSQPMCSLSGGERRKCSFLVSLFMHRKLF